MSARGMMVCALRKPGRMNSSLELRVYRGGYSWIGKEKRKEEIVACGDLILGQKEIYEKSSD